VTVHGFRGPGFRGSGFRGSGSEVQGSEVDPERRTLNAEPVNGYDKSLTKQDKRKMNKPSLKKNSPHLSVAHQRRSSLNSTIRDQSGAGKTKIGEILSKEGYINRTHLEDALNYQKKK